MPTLFLIEDELKLRKLLVRSLTDRPQWEVHAFETAEEALLKSKEILPDLILTDLRLPGMGGLDLIRTIKEKNSEIAILVMTAYASVSSAVEALRAGAVDYLIKPFPNEELLHVLDRLENEFRLKRENATLKKRLEVYEGPSGLVGSSEKMRKLDRLISKVAPTQSTVLIRGESGTGKELIARAIHDRSGRSDQPLVRVNCAAIPENLLESELFGHKKGAFTGATEKRIGRFEMAGEGTIFLDEIGEIPPNLQVKLLRVLQEREFEPVGSSETKKTKARVIAATNRDLETAIEEGTFREDLFYRLNVVTLESPRLADHLEDLPDLVTHFIQKICEREGLSPKTPSESFLETLESWDWPGNTRELENVIESSLIMGEGDELEEGDLPSHIRRSASKGVKTNSPSGIGAVEEGIDLETATLDQVERHLILKALERSNGNQSEAARSLGMTRRALGYRREKHGI
ncbi:MAG: sigma-54-dependent Fis family transcriptional regulator [Candidatus Omnitrophica bacterium]|nr:sigma-54-dependent Fis family transcriptional regulator [Candidatus Omnitrophota bacterium]